ncbi:MAG: pyruvate ferredoxin oxidoreductase alpha subunit [Clostridia bacterium]|nr:pyruvate ferredoxin oxidoreductase alpha subunit [Clostridia bacterium]
MTRCFISGSMAVAEAAQLAGVQVIAAYPITPQTGIVEALARKVATGLLGAEMIPVESEHSALSAVVGASLAGARAFTATSSQGLALMHEVLPYASGLRLPIVMAVANRSLASPVTIFNDHQDSLPERDSGWIQVYVENAQEAFDYLLIAYRVAEDAQVLLPFMVCLDGFSVSHTYEPVDIPAVELVNTFLPPFRANYPHLDLAEPKVFNVMAFPEHFEEFQRDKHESNRKVLGLLNEVYDHFARVFGRRRQNLEAYRVEDAELVLVGMGSMMGTVRGVVDDLRARGQKVGMVRMVCFRPLPVQEIQAVLQGAGAIGVLDRDVSFGAGGILYQDIARSMYNSQGKRVPAVNFIAGLGGRDVNPATIQKCFYRLASVASSGYITSAEELQWPDENEALLRAWGVGDKHGN